MKVGDLVEHIDYSIGIVVDVVTYEQYVEEKRRSMEGRANTWSSRFPLIYFTVFEPISFEDSDSGIKTQTTFIADQFEIAEGEIEVISESR